MSHGCVASQEVRWTIVCCLSLAIGPWSESDSFSFSRLSSSSSSCQSARGIKIEILLGLGPGGRVAPLHV